MWGPAQTDAGAGGTRGSAAAGGEQNDGSLWVPQGDGLLHGALQPAAVGLQPAGNEGGAALLPLQGVGQPSPLLIDMPQLDGALLPPLPDLTLAGAATAGAGQPADSGFAATAGAVDKQAISREKNKLAQRRFREKERQKLAEAEAAAAAVRRQLTQMRMENERLQTEHALLQKLLVVRDAILSVVAQLDGQPPQQGQQAGLPPQQPAAMQQPAAVQPSVGSTLGAAAAGPSVAALLQDPAALQAASQQLAAALGELPSLEQMELMVAELGGDSGTVTDASGSSGAGSSGAGSSSAAAAGVAAVSDSATAPAIPPVGVTVGAAAASGVVVERTRLQEVMPPLCPEARKEVESIDHVELLLEYWRQWRLQLQQLFQEAQAANFADSEQQDALGQHMQDFVAVFWAACHDRPQLFNMFLTRCLPPPGVDASAEWRRVALESLPHLTDGEVAMFRSAMHQYTKRIAVAAVGVRPWVRRLQAVVAAQHSAADSMVHMAGQHAQVREVVARMQHACTEQYLAYIDFLAQMSAHTSVTLRALWHTSSDPYGPDHPAIVNQILQLHQQRQRQQLAGSQPPIGAGQAQLEHPSRAMAQPPEQPARAPPER